MWLGTALKLPAPFDRLQHCHFVSVLNVTARRYSGGNTCDFHAWPLDQPCQMHGSGFAFDGRVRRDDDFIHVAVFDSLQQ